MRTKATAEQREKAIERRQKMRSIAKEIGKMSAEERASLVRNWPTTIEGRQLSLFNACMILRQYPSATVVGGVAQWRKAGRYVSSGKGSGLGIWYPVGAGKAGEGAEQIHDESPAYFMVGTVFDISQTSERNGREAAAQAMAEGVREAVAA